MTSRRKLLMAIAIALINYASCSKPDRQVTPRGPLGGDYGPVTKELLRGKHICSSRQSGRFTWFFSAEAFTIAKDGEPIPPDVLATVLGADARAEVIEGKWELAGRILTLSEIKADNKGGFEDVQLRPFRTPVLRISFGEKQYVLQRRQ